MYRVLNRQDLANQHLARAEELDKTGALKPSPESNTQSQSPTGGDTTLPDISSFLEGVKATQPLDSLSTPDFTSPVTPLLDPTESSLPALPDLSPGAADAPDSPGAATPDPVVPADPAPETETTPPEKKPEKKDEAPSLFDDDLFPE